jgi:hypothetical protein
MKKPLAAAAAKKKTKSGVKQGRNRSPLKSLPFQSGNPDPVKSLAHQIQRELLDKIDQKFNALNHRLDRIDEGIDEVLEELRATEALLESDSEPYEGQA